MSRTLLLPLALLAGCGRAAPPPAPAAPVVAAAAEVAPPPRAAFSAADLDAASARGVAFLLKQQSADGAWRSDVYATFKDGTALTPLVVAALQDDGSPATAAARRKGSEFLAKHVQPDGTITADLDYPVYTAALSVVVLSHSDNAGLLKARDAWLTFLLDRQLTGQLGWTPDDKEFGGWGYCRTLPRKPEPGKLAPPLVESNLSATVFALEALAAAGRREPAAIDAAGRYVLRRANPDGGFHFVDDDPVRNKGGLSGVKWGGRSLPNSYGSTTADAVRGLWVIAGGKGWDCARDPGPLAVQWLCQYFEPDRHPGDYVPAHEPNRDAVYFYYAASVAKAFRRAKVDEAGGKSWAPALAAALAARQRADGSWANPVELVRENDPVVATANAVTALAHCRAALIQR